MQVKAFYAGGFAAVSYLVTDDTGDVAVLIDPAVSYAEVMVKTVPMPKIAALLLTHGHFDHMLSLAEWKEKTGAPICVTREDAPALTDAYLNCNRMFFGTDGTYPPADRLLDEGDTIPVGTELLTVMKTPGHTPGSCVFVGKEDIFTGDTMMTEGAYGRYDLPGGSAEALYKSLLRIASLSGDYRLYPGHGREGTLKEEKNYYIR